MAMVEGELIALGESTIVTTPSVDGFSVDTELSDLPLQAGQSSGNNGGLLTGPAAAPSTARPGTRCDGGRSRAPGSQGLWISTPLTQDSRNGAIG